MSPPRFGPGRAASVDEVSAWPAWPAWPAWGSPRGRCGHQISACRRSPRNTAAARCIASALPPCPLTNTTPAAQSAERATSITTSAITSDPIESVPGKPSCSPLAEIVIGGATTASSLRATRSWASSVAITVSVCNGRCGPCCSQLPTGTTTIGSTSSVHLIAPSSVLSSPIRADASQRSREPRRSSHVER